MASIAQYWVGTPSRQRYPVALVVAAAIGLLGAMVLTFVASATSPIVAALAVVGLAVTVGIFISPNFGLLTLILVMPYERIGRFTEDFDKVDISLARIVGMVLLGSLLLSAFLKRYKLTFNTPCKLYAGYATLAALGIIWALSPEETQKDALRIIGNLLFLFVLVNMIRSWKIVRSAVIVWLLATMGTCLYSTYDYYFSGSSDRVEESQMGLTSKRFSAVVNDDSESLALGGKVRRAFGPTAHPAIFGLNLTMSIPFFFWAIRTEKSRLMLLVWFAGLMLTCLNIFLANTRAVILLAILTFVLTAVLRLWVVTPKTIFALAVVAAAVFPFIPEDVYMRSLDPTLYSAAKGESIRIRFKLLGAGWDLLTDHWVGGIGVGNQTTIVDMITDEHAGRITPAGFRASAHNEYLWTAVETGVVGWFLHWMFIAWVTWSSFKAASLLKRWNDCSDAYWMAVACQIPMVGILLFALQTEVFHLPIKGWWFMIGITSFLLDYARRRMQAEQAMEAAA